MNIRDITILIILFTCSIGSLFAQDSIILNQRICYTLAIENCEMLSIAHESVNQAEGEMRAAKSAYFPNLSASAIGLYRSMDLQTELYLPTMSLDPESETLVPDLLIDPTTGAPMVDASGNAIFSFYAYMPVDYTINGGVMVSVTAEQPIYAGGKIVAGNSMAKLGASMAKMNTELVESNVKYEVDQSYYLFLSTQEKVRLAERYLELLKTLYRVVNDSYELGMTNRNELLKVKVQQNEAKLQLQQAQSGLKLARLSLCRVVGLPFTTEFMIDDSLNNYNFNQKLTEGALVSRRIEYQLLKQKADMSKENVKMVRADYLPSAGVQLGYNYTNVFLENTENYDSKGLSGMGSVTIPLTSFGERRGKVTSAKASAEIEALELQQQAELMQLEIEQARLNYIDAYTRIELSKEAVDQADENMRISNDRYILGLETIVNLLEAQTQWQSAYSDYIEAIAHFKVKESNLKRVTVTN